MGPHKVVAADGGTTIGSKHGYAGGIAQEMNEHG
jgi:hypothetical protein